MDKSVTFNEFLKSMAPAKRVQFKKDMVEALEVSVYVFEYWRQSNMIPQYAKDYLVKYSPVDVVFNWTPGRNKQSKKVTHG